MTDGFLHLHDAEDGSPVRVRISKIDLMYVETDRKEFHGFHGSVAVEEKDPFTMLVLSEGVMHGVQETISDIEGQMSDFFELAGMASAQ